MTMGNGCLRVTESNSSFFRILWELQQPGPRQGSGRKAWQPQGSLFPAQRQGQFVPRLCHLGSLFLPVTMCVFWVSGRRRKLCRSHLACLGFRRFSNRSCLEFVDAWQYFRLKRIKSYLQTPQRSSIAIGTSKLCTTVFKPFLKTKVESSLKKLWRPAF